MVLPKLVVTRLVNLCQFQMETWHFIFPQFAPLHAIVKMGSYLEELPFTQWLEFEQWLVTIAIYYTPMALFKGLSEFSEII
jgi:hypothetical protein